jgi:hypothetical protein
MKCKFSLDTFCSGYREIKGRKAKGNQRRIFPLPFTFFWLTPLQVLALPAPILPPLLDEKTLVVVTHPAATFPLLWFLTGEPAPLAC